MKEIGVYNMSERVSYKEMVELYNSGFNKLNEKLDKIEEKLEAVHIQATKTNGRVNRLEDCQEKTDNDIIEIKLEFRKILTKVAYIAGSLSALGILTNFLI
ncbi:MAG: hypothetical protein EOL95_09735 [Bacteroidia bacterium]|nr:hypothetical protein [Bacteroidia bacterium]